MTCPPMTSYGGTDTDGTLQVITEIAASDYKDFALPPDPDLA
jgi:hypothetical protein